MLESSLKFPIAHISVVKNFVIFSTASHYINTLDISDNDVNANILERLVESLNENTTTLTHLYMSNCNLNHEALEQISYLITQSRNLTTIDLSKNRFGSEVREVKMLKYALEENARLDTLNLSYNQFIPKTMSILLKGINANCFLTDLDLSWTCVGANIENAKCLAEILKNPETNISTLKLISVGFYDRQEGGTLEIFANALLENHVLKHLDLSQNSIHSTQNSKGILRVLEAAVANQELEFESLVFEYIGVGKECAEFMKNHENELANVKIKTGELMEQPKKAKEKKIDPMTKLETWLSEKGMNLNQFFMELDDDESMTLSYDELREGIRKWDIPMTDEEVTELIHKLDLDGDGDINFA